MWVSTHHTTLVLLNHVDSSFRDINTSSHAQYTADMTYCHYYYTNNYTNNYTAQQQQQVEFLKEAAEQSIEDVVQCATDLRALTAFLSCGQARAAILRAKAAATVLKCVKRVGPRLGATREADKVLGILPLFLQDGNQETRHHGKAITSYLLSTVNFSSSSSYS
jgi:hypothetical protein